MARGFEWDRGRVAWWLFGLALGAASLYVVWRFVGTFVFGIFLYYASRPVYKVVHDRGVHGYRIDRPGIAAATSLTLFLLPSLVLVSYTLLIAYSEARKFADLAGELASSGEFEQYEGLIEPYLQATELVAQPGELLTGAGFNAVSDILFTSLRYLGTVAIFVLHLFVIVAIAFYLLRDDRKLARWFTARFADDRGVLDEYLSVVDNDFNNIFFGNILNAVFTGTIGAIVFTLLNLVSPAGLSIPYAALVGLLTGTASLIPVVGMKLVYVPVALYLFTVPILNQQPELMWFPVTFSAVSLVVVDTIPDLVLRPYVSGRSLHIGALMLAYILGPLLFGWYGLFLAPMLLVLVVHFGRIVMPELIAGEPMKPYAVDPTYLAGEGVADNPSTRRQSGPPTGGDHADDDAGDGDDDDAGGDAVADDADATDAPAEGSDEPVDAEDVTTRVGDRDARSPAPPTDDTSPESG